MTATRKTTQRRGGSRTVARVVAILGVWSWLAPASCAERRTPQGKPSEAYAVVAGTVFQDDGRVLRGAQVEVRANPETGAPPKGRPLNAVTDQRGEFAFRVPAVPMRYNVNIRARGFRVQEKAVSVSGDERVDVFFQMEREASGK